MRRRPVDGTAPTLFHFAGTVHLTKREAFDACQALADADRFLLRAGHFDTARALGDVFELLEERLSAPSPVPATGNGANRAVQAFLASGSNPSDGERLPD